MNEDTLIGYAVATVLAFWVATIAAWPHMQDNRSPRVVSKPKGLTVFTDANGNIID